MMINKLAKIISAVAVLGMTVSFAPESALAQKFSGPASNRNDRFSFEINPSASYTPSTSYTGAIFSGAIQNAIYTSWPSSPNENPQTNIDYKFNQGDLKVSLEENISDSLRNDLNNRSSGSSFDGKFGSTVVKYEADLEDNSNPKKFFKFAFYAPYINPFTNLASLSVFNASNLNPFLDLEGKVSFPRAVTFFNQSNSDWDEPLIAAERLDLSFTPDNVTKVPESSATASLLSFGIVSIALLRKRHKRL